ncbi:EAL domain-containing protein [Pleionea sediminis]|uniref:EAL domain-containing protein n=1 Tax=Pleionea sediminis TaxID=2569479 RepID=UPI0011847002|nr:EAL domain-containing protein [Pleionea sediminis]
MTLLRLTGLLLLLLCNEGFAKSQIVIDDNFSKLFFSTPIQTLKETHSELPEEIIHSIRFEEKTFNESMDIGYNAYWYKLSVSGDLNQLDSKTLHLVFSTHHLRHLDVFLYENKTLIKSQALGLLSESPSNGLYKGPTFRFKINKNQKLTILIRKQNDGSNISPLTLYDNEAFNEALFLKYLLWGGAIALLCALGLYNVFIYALNPGFSYFWYLIFHASVFTYFSTMHGFGYLIWPQEFLTWLGQNLMPMHVLIVWIALQFARTFLQTEVNAPSLHGFIKFFDYFTPIALVLVIWLPEYMTVMPFLFYQAFASVLGLALATSALLNDYRPARYFLLSWIFVIVGAAITAAAYTNLIQATNVTIHAFFAGTICELLLLSIALADRLRYAEKKAISKAYIDPQRKLPNYSFFINEFATQLVEVRKARESIALVVVHTKNYQELVGLLGPNILEPIYREHVARLEKYLTTSPWAVTFTAPSENQEYFVSLPGDQILFLIEVNQDLEEKLKSLLTFTTEPLIIKNFEVSLDIHVGATIIDSKKLSPLELYRKVQIALLHCSYKEREWNIYTNEQDISLKEHGALLRDIKKAIADHEFNIMIQPQFDLFTQQLVGGEVLVRWDHHNRGDVNPGEFVLVAEQTGIISKITHQIIEHAFHWLSMQSSLPDKFLLSINLSAQDLYDDHLLPFIENKMETYKVHPHNIAFEITESSMMKNAQKSLNTINELQSRGFSIAIDDFGTGYSSLSYLQQINADKIKIDLSFIRNINHKKTNKAITATISKLSKSIQAKTVAEGIENADELLVVKQLKCDIGQGIFWSEPLKPEIFSRRYNTQKNVFEDDEYEEAQKPIY